MSLRSKRACSDLQESSQYVHYVDVPFVLSLLVCFGGFSRFGLMQGCFTKFYLPLLTMNWTTDTAWRCFPYQYSHGNQGSHRELASSTFFTLMSTLRRFSSVLRFAEFFWRKNHHIWPHLQSSSCLCINLLLLWIDNWVEHLKKFILFTHLWSSWLKCWSSYYTRNEGSVVHRTLDTLRVLFTFQA